MLLRLLPATAGAMLAVGCAAVPAQPAPGPDSPASPAADEAPIPPRSRTLALTDGALPRPTAAADPAELRPEMGGTGHDMAGMQHDAAAGTRHDHGMAGMTHVAPATRPGESAALSAPRWTPTTVPTTGPAAAAVPTVYTCAMHPEVISNEPGECPRCGMRLVPVRGAGQPEHGGHGGHGGGH